MIAIIEQNPILSEIFEKVVVLFELGVDIPQAVDDRVEWRCDLFLDPLLDLIPETEIVHQFLMINDHQHIVIADVAMLWVIHPGTLGVAAEKNDLEDATAQLGLRGFVAVDALELILSEIDDGLDLSLLRFR
ncbi:MAG: hypothetical protein P8163_19700 [Candidatus Thiodiazotropha sp.]